MAKKKKFRTASLPPFPSHGAMLEGYGERGGKGNNREILVS
jgi:hypothetical protein